MVINFLFIFFILLKKDLIPCSRLFVFVLEKDKRYFKSLLLEKSVAMYGINLLI